MRVLPLLTVNFTTDAYGQTMVTVNATANIRTFFMRLVPKYSDPDRQQ